MVCWRKFCHWVSHVHEVTTFHHKQKGWNPGLWSTFSWRSSCCFLLLDIWLCRLSSVTMKWSSLFLHPPFSITSAIPEKHALFWGGVGVEIFVVASAVHPWHGPPTPASMSRARPPCCRDSRPWPRLYLSLLLFFSTSHCFDLVLIAISWSWGTRPQRSLSMVSSGSYSPRTPAKNGLSMCS